MDGSTLYQIEGVGLGLRVSVRVTGYNLASKRQASRARAFRALPGLVNVRGSIPIVWGAPSGVQLVVDGYWLRYGLVLLRVRARAIPHLHYIQCVI